MEAPPKSYGPTFVKNAQVLLKDLSVDDPSTGWREPSESRVQELYASFWSGNFGLTVTCGVQILNKEDSGGKKIIDDGVSTVKALLLCQAQAAAEASSCGTVPVDAARAKSHGVVSAALRDVFENGLVVRIVQYSDDDDRQLRENWNIAKHDEENHSVRWSTLWQKLNAARSRFKQLGSWTEATESLLELYGPGKRSTVGRWIRAARGIDEDVFEHLKTFPELRGTFLWDNNYLIVSAGAKQREQLSSKFAVKALRILQNNPDCTGPAFQDKVCKPMKVVEIWMALMTKRFGSVASLSPAMHRLVDHLCTSTGLESVTFCLQKKANLQDGISECGLLLQEFEKCKAGGLPPPAKIPTDAEKKAEEQRLKKQAEAEAKAKVEAEQKALKESEEEKARTDFEALTHEADLCLLTGDLPKSGSGVIVVEPKLKSVEDLAAATVAGSLDKVHFETSLQTLVEKLGKARSNRSVILLDCPTTSLKGFIGMLEAAGKMWEAIRSTADEYTRFRVVVLIGSRFELIAKLTEKVKQYFGNSFQTMVVQLKSKDRQSERSKPTYAVMCLPGCEISQNEHTAVSVTGKKYKSENKLWKYALRCTEAHCRWRPEALRGGAQSKAETDPNMEIDPEDRIDVLSSLMGELEDEDDVDGQPQDAADMDVDSAAQDSQDMRPPATGVQTVGRLPGAVRAYSQGCACDVAPSPARRAVVLWWPEATTGTTESGCSRGALAVFKLYAVLQDGAHFFGGGPQGRFRRHHFCDGPPESLVGGPRLGEGSLRIDDSLDRALREPRS